MVSLSSFQVQLFLLCILVMFTIYCIARVCKMILEMNCTIPNVSLFISTLIVNCLDKRTTDRNFSFYTIAKITLSLLTISSGLNGPYVYEISFVFL